MGLQGIFDKSFREIMSRVVGRPAQTGAAAIAAPLAQKAGMALDGASVKLLDRSAVDEVARFNADLARRSPAMLREKYTRMAESPFAFFRGTDHLFYSDLGRLDPEILKQGPQSVLQGDMHLGNFGSVVKPDGSIKWGLSDFDEAYAGPVQLDLARMNTSIALQADEMGLSADETRRMVRHFTESYHETMSHLAEDPVGKWPNMPKKPVSIENLLKQAKDAKRGEWLDQLAPKQNGVRRFVRSKTTQSVDASLQSDIEKAVTAYRRGLPPELQSELEGYQVKDVVSAVGGVGSVGRERYRVLLDAPNKKPMVLELKEEVPAAASVLQKGPAPAIAEADRVVGAAKTMLGGTDPYMSTTTLPARDGLESPSFMVRRLDPTKASLDLSTLKPDELGDVLRYYGRKVAEAHANGGQAGFADAATILQGLPSRDALIKQQTSFAQRYAQQVKRDFQDFKKSLN